MSGAIDLSEKLSTFSEHWSPRTVTQFNDCNVMVVKVKGEFVWHKHDDTDDFFLVLKGSWIFNFAIEPSRSGQDKCSWYQRASSIGPLRGERCIYC
jgi:mannose-6-phosphate isomerase-like protein (cupin superfamily)